MADRRGGGRNGRLPARLVSIRSFERRAGRERAAAPDDHWVIAQTRLAETLLQASTAVWQMEVATGAISQTGGFRVAPLLQIGNISEFLALVHPDDRTWVTAGLEQQLALGEPWSAEYRIVLPSGQVRWMQDRGTVYTDTDGERRTRAVIVDITERKEAELALTRSEERLRALQAAGRIGTVDWRIGEPHMVVSSEYRALYGLSSHAVVTFESWLASVHPDDQERVARAYRGAFDVEFRIIRPDTRETRWINAKGELVTDAAGQPLRLLSIQFDITERRLAEEREHLLMREVDHRAKNLLAVVQSIVRLTRADTTPAFIEAVTGRVDAMARAHSLLAAARWDGADLHVLIEEELAAFNRDEARATAYGPDLKLKPSAAQSLALVIHELATNAAKYGALSVRGGRVSVVWSYRAAPGETLWLSWQERGGPAVAPPKRQGFGSSLIRASVERQLHGTVLFDWAAHGLRCELTLPTDVIVRAHLPASTHGPPVGQPRGARGIAGRKVLVVDDEALIAMEVETHLLQAGAQVIGPVGDIPTALAAIHDRPPDAALLDISLADGPCFPLADILAERGVPIGFATGFGSGPSVPERLRHVPVLSKPFAPSELLAFVQNLLGGDRPASASGGGAPSH